MTVPHRTSQPASPALDSALEPGPRTPRLPAMPAPRNRPAYGTASHHRVLRCALSLLAAGSLPALPPDYRGTPFQDAVHRTGPPVIPGIVQAALYDLGGEGVAYRDTDPVNNGSGKLNLEPGHQRAHASAYVWQFRQNEGVDLSFVKDWADLNHTNRVTPHVNQFYIGWTEDGEWCTYTVNVLRPGDYRIRCLYAFQTNVVSFDLDGRPAASCRLPQPTASYHHWTLEEIGRIRFPEAGLHRLTFRYGKGNNFAYFEFEPVAPPLPATAP